MMKNLQVQIYIIIDKIKRERNLRKGHATQNRWKSKFMYKMTSMKTKFTMGHSLEFQLTLRMLGTFIFLFFFVSFAESFSYFTFYFKINSGIPSEW